MFNQDRIAQKGLSLAEMALLSIAALLVWFIGAFIVNALSGQDTFFRLGDWGYIREGIGIPVGMLLYGYFVPRVLKLGLFGQFIGIVVGASGGGALTLFLIEVLVTRLS